MIGKIIKFFNSNFFVALVGGSAIYLYIKQRKDSKRDIARLILQEIRYAEHQIRIARDQGYNYYLANKLLPTNNWDNNIHLFVKDLKETQIDLITRFYANAAYLDHIISIISRQKSQLMVPVGQQQTLPISPEESVQQAPQQFELNASRILKDVSGKIEFIYNTPIVDKLRKIAEKKWYHLF